MRYPLLASLSFMIAASPAAAAGWLVRTQGSVEVSGPSGRIEVKVPMEIPPGATIRAASGGSALFMLTDGTKIQVQPDSTFTYEDSAGESLFSLARGMLSLWVKPQGARRLSVRTPGSVASVRGTKVDAETDGTVSHFDVFEGEVAVGDDFGHMTIATPGQRVTTNARRGLTGTSSLPQGSRAKAEPEGDLPPAAKGRETARSEQKEKKEKGEDKQEAKGEIESESSSPAYNQVSGNPTQEIDADDASPSAP